MKTMRNNRGVAMVTVLIAVSFIIILASSLMYMSYMNYITKAVRYHSTDNFYTDEFALDELCMALQQTVVHCSSVDEAKSTLKTAIGAEINTNGVLQYNNTAVAGLIIAANTEADITVSTNVATSDGINTLTPNVVDNGNQFKLIGVMITSTTAEGYQSTISTDITINFPSGGLGDLDINDFSVITDSPVVVTAGDIFFSGCVYIGKDNSGKALQINNNANVHILSPRGIINGDIIIEGNSLLSITGIVTVTGDIWVKGNSTLLCSSQLQHKGEIHVQGNGRVIGIDSGDFGPQDINTDSIDHFDNGLTGELFTDIYVRSPETTEFKQISLEQFIGSVPWTKDFQNMPSGTRVGSGIGTQGTLNNEFDNSLILTTNGAVVKGELTNSSVVCSGPLTFDEPSMATYMQNMDDDIYEAAKAVMIYANGGSCNVPGVNNAKWAQGLWQDSYVDSANDTKEITYDDADNTTRTFVFSGDKMYVPCGYFLVPDTSRIISDAFGGVQGDPDPSNTVIFIENWTKE